MGRSTGNYSAPSGDLWDEKRQFVAMLQQQGAPLVDALMNTFSYVAYAMIRRVIQNAMGPAGTPYAKFQIQPAAGDQTQNFQILGGDGTVSDSGVGSDLDHEGPARFYLGGHMALLPSTKEYRNNSITRPLIHSQITAVVGNAVTDTSAFFGEYGDTLVGRPFYPDITSTDDDTGIAPLGYAIESVTDVNTLILDLSSPYNADGTASVSSPAPDTLESTGIAAGDYYRIGLTSPSVDRTDTVVLDVYEDEIDGTDDPMLLRTIEGTSTPSANARAVRQRIEVLEGVDVTDSPEVHGAYPLYYTRGTDRDGNIHHRVALATIYRPASAADITDVSPSNITNLDVTTNDLWALTFGTLPPTTTDSSITDDPSVGVNTATGSYGGATLDISRLLLQMLGNVSDEQNKAFQNMGDRINGAGTVVAGDPGTGENYYEESPSTGRHLALLTNDEMGAMLNAVGIAEGDAATTNCLISKRGHGGLQENPSTTPTGAVAPHANPTGSSAVVTTNGGSYFAAGLTSNNSQFLLGQTVFAAGYGWNDFGPDGDDSFKRSDFNKHLEGLLIPINGVLLGGLTQAQIESRYAVTAIAGIGGGVGNDSNDYEGAVVCRGWSVANNKLNVVIDMRSIRPSTDAAWGAIFLVSR